MRTLNSFVQEFSSEMESASYFLAKSQTEGSMAEKRRLYDGAVDAFGDARKTIEDLESSYLRDRIENLHQSQYEEVRGNMIQSSEKLHSKLLEAHSQYFPVAQNAQEAA